MKSTTQKILRGEMNNWYDRIEEPVRALVKLLRDNGFNTFCSCGHEKYIQMAWYACDDIERLYNLLWDSGYKDFELHLFWRSSGVGRFMEVKLK